MSRSVRVAAGTSGALFLVSAFILYVAWPVDVALPWLLLFMTTGVGLLAGVVATTDQLKQGPSRT